MSARHLLSVADLGRGGIDELLRLTDTFVEVSNRAIPKAPALRGKTVVSLFYEDSTRTRLSFETAAKRLSADTMTFSVGTSSVKKGESVRDTVETIEAMGIDAVVVRHGSAGVPWQVAEWLGERVSVINGGDGWHEHPTQALLDCYTIRQRLGDLDGLRIAIVGDIKHSRVARSDVLAYTALGAEVTLVAPPTLLPPRVDGWPVRVSSDLDDVLRSVDVVGLLRMQNERMTEALIPSLPRVHRPLRAQRRAPRPDGRQGHRHASRPDEPRRRDQRRGGDQRSLGDPRPGPQRRRRPHGRPVPTTRKRSRPDVSSVVIKGGRVLDPSGERVADVVVEAGRVVAVGSDLAGDVVLDAGGCVVSPGLVDLHTHLRQPGREEAETVETGSRAAALGGFTCVVAMPNTEPAIDCASVAEDVLLLGRDALCDVRTSAAITVGRQGERLTEMAELASLGIRLFTDDGNGVQDDRLMRRAMEYASGLSFGGRGVVLAQHCENEALSAGGHMNEGEWSSRLGIPAQPAEAEELMVMRDIALARLTGATIHFQHLSTAGSIAMVRAAKGGGLPVSAEATPHHFTLTEAACASYDPVFKVNPPLRTAADVAAVKAGLADGCLDAIATDHAPHAPELKELPFDQAPPGMLGLETALALALTELELPLAEILALLSWRPAAIAGVADEHGGRIEAGTPANLCVIDPNATWTVDPLALASKAYNTPFAGRELRGRVRHTVRRGETVVLDGETTR